MFCEKNKTHFTYCSDQELNKSCQTVCEFEQFLNYVAGFNLVTESRNAFIFKKLSQSLGEKNPLPNPLFH